MIFNEPRCAVKDCHFPVVEMHSESDWDPPIFLCEGHASRGLEDLKQYMTIGGWIIQ